MLQLDHDQLLVLAWTVVLAPVAAAICALLLRRSPVWIDRATVGFSVLSLAAATLIASGPIQEFPLQFTILSLDFVNIHFGLYLDALSVYFMLLVNLVALIASWYAIHFLAADARHNPKHNPVQFHVFFNLFHFTMLAVPMVDNLVGLWMAVELTTVVSTILVRYRRDRPALEAAWKFIIITTTGIIFALLGTLFLANAINDSTLQAIRSQGLGGDPMRWSVLARPEVASTLNRSFVVLSFLFVLIGYGTKAGLAPMHTWLPDGHGEAPSPVSALLSGVMLKSALYAILRFYTITNLNQGNAQFTSTILLIAGLFSLALATPFILKLNRFKRVLAYHSLEHMGIIMFGIGIGTPVAIFGALLHALNHGLTKALMFLIFGYVYDEYRDRIPGFREEHIRGVWKSMPITGTILAGGGLALVGSPPFNIFMSEFIILWAALDKALTGAPSLSLLLAVAIFLVTVTAIFGGLVRHMSRLLLGRPPFPTGEQSIERLRDLAPLAILIVAIVIFGVLIPSVLVDFPRLLEQSSNILLRGVAR